MIHRFATAERTVLPELRASVFFDGILTEPRLQHAEGVSVGPDRRHLVRRDEDPSRGRRRPPGRAHEGDHAYDYPEAGTVKVVAPAVKMSETPATIDRPAPLVGDHTREILAEFGYAPGEIRALLDRGTVAGPA
jgi:hypothetical protein